MNTTGRGFPPGALRVSDADRDRAVSELSEHFHGRLTADEFDERSGQALRARTGTDLANLFDDLPRSETAAPAPIAGPPAPPGAAGPPGAPGPGQRVPAMFAARIAFAVIAFAVLASLLGSGHHGQNGGLTALFPILAVLLVVRLLVLGGRRRR